MDHPDTTPHLHLTISVLGPVRAHRDGRAIVLGGRRQRGVLARLAIAGGHVVPTDRVIDDLWAGEPPASAANTLQSYVSNLRKALGGSAPVIERVGDGYRISTEAADLTTGRFERLVDAALQASEPAEARVARLDAALDLWDGPALGDLADEAWAKGEAVRLDELRLAAIEERFRLLLELGRHATVVGDLAAAVDAHPLRERLAEQLVLALYRCGRQPEAIAAYEATREHLADELGLDPSPDLARLAEAVAGRDPSLDLAAHVPAPAPPPEPAATPGLGGGFVPVPVTPGPLDLPPAVTERRARSPFVGRERELEALHQVWREVEAGERRLVTISGESGMGKTRLAQVFCQQAHAAGTHVMWGRCTAENLVAYQPAAEGLRGALRAVNPDILSAIVDPRPALRILLPSDDQAVPAETPNDASRYDLYEALSEVLGDVATSLPIIWVVDDAQWADRSTLTLIEHLLRQEQTGRLLIVATVRRPAGRSTADLDRLLADLRRDGHLRQVEVTGMSNDDVATLLAGHGVAAAGELAGSLRDRTGGNPFFLESLAEQGDSGPDLDARDLPESVRDLIDQRVDALDPEVARVLVAAAVIGQRVDLDLLGAVTGLAVDPLLDVVDVAVDAALLAEDEDIGWVTFPHALVRHALIARTTRNREAQLHLQVAGALEELAGPDRDLAVAQHLASAGRLCPPERAARAALDAARSALARFSDEEARTWAKRTVEVLAPFDDDATWELTADARLIEAEADRRLGDVKAAQTALDAVIGEARSRRDQRVLARAAQERCLSIAGVGFAFGTVDLDLLGLLDEALRSAPDDRPADRTSLLAWSSIARNGTDQRREQQARAAQAVSGAREQPERSDLLALSLLADRLAHAAPDGLEHRLLIGPEMGAAAAAAGWSDLIVVGMVLDVVDLLESGDAHAARARIEDLESYIVPFARPLYDAYHLFLAAAVAQMEGRHAEAEALSARANDLGETSHADNARHARAGQLFVLARDLGTVGELVPLTGAMVEEYPTMAVWLTGHATACAAAGDLDAAREACAQVFAVGGLEAMDSTWSTSLAQLAEVCWMIGEAEWCAELARRLAPVANHLAVTGMGAVCLGSLQRGLALALDGAGDLEGAISAMDEAVAVSDAQGITLWLARALAERSLLLERRDAPGDAERVQQDRARAHELAAALGVRLALGPDEYPRTRGHAMSEGQAAGVRLSVLGPVRAWRDGKPAALGGHRQRAVLVRLALSGGDAVPVDRLIDDLWAGEPPPSATSTLQSYLSHLRKALGGGSLIERVGAAYRLQLADGALDADRFADLVERASASTGPARLDLLDEALGLWSGRAIADFADEEWARGDAVRLEQLHLAALHDRFDVLLALGRHTVAVGELEAAVAEHPLHEPFAAQLVLALYRCGRQAEALRAVERTRATLAAEVGVGLGPELTQLADRVLLQDPGLERAADPAGGVETAADAGPSRGPDPAGGSSDPVDEGSTASPLPLPPAVAERRTRSAFVGRTQERAALDRAWSAAMAGERHLLVVAGEAGVGKTRLAQETCRALHARGAYVLWGRCTPEHLIAYQPVVESLRTALRSLPVERVRELVEPRPALGLLLPELAEGVDLPARAGPFELYESMADLLGEVTIATPMLLVIDDLQWADPSTLTLLDQVLANPLGGRVLIIATMRRPAGRATPEVDRFLAEARRARRYTAVDLEGLDRTAASELLGERGLAVEGRDLDALLERTAGNPLFIESLAEPGDDAALAEPRDLPASVRDLFDQRLQLVDERTATVAIAAAVVGQRVDIDLLGTVTGLDQADLLDVLDEGIEAGLFAEDEDIGWVTFPHALVRQALIARTTRNREARLHVAVADALEARPPGPDHAVTVAQHLFAAGRACPPHRAAAAAIAAGRRALEVVADEEAATWARRALDVLAPVADRSAEWDTLQAESLLLLAEAHRLRGRLDDARRALSGVTDLARAAGDGALLARAAQQWALVTGAIGFSFGGLDDDLIALIDEALAALGPDDHAERATLLSWSSLALNPGDDRDGQEALSIAALEAAAEVPERAHVQALALFARHIAVGGAPGLDERLSLLAPLRSAARGWSELEVLARALAVIDLLEADRVPEAEAAMEDLRGFVEPYHRPALDTFVAFFDAMWALLRGDLEEAEARSNHGLAIGAEAHGDNAATAWAGQQFLLAIERGALGSFVDELSGMVEAQPLVPIWGIALARGLAARGERERAIEVAHGYLAAPGLDVHARSVARYMVAALAAEVCWLTGDRLLADHVLVELAPISHRICVAGLAAGTAGPLTRHHGLALAVAGDLDGAEALLDLAAANAGSVGFQPAQAHALWERAVVLRRRGGQGDETEADRCAAEAAALAAATGVDLGAAADEMAW